MRYVEHDVNAPIPLENLTEGASIHDLLEGYVRSDTEHEPLEAQPSLYVRHGGYFPDDALRHYEHPTDHPTFGHVVMTARLYNGLNYEGIPTILSYPVIHDDGLYVITQTVTKENDQHDDLAETLRNKPSPEILRQTDQIMGNVALHYLRSRQETGLAAKDILGAYQYFYGSVSIDPRLLVRLVDVTGGLVEVSAEYDDPDDPIDSYHYERDLFELTDNILHIEQTTGQRLTHARAGISEAMSASDISQETPESIVRGIHDMLENGHAWYLDDFGAHRAGKGSARI